MTSQELITKAKTITTISTVYMWGSFGQKLTAEFIEQKAKQYPEDYNARLVSYLKAKIEKNSYAFDCSGLIKGLLWGWNNGVGEYQSNDVPDMNANTMIDKCSDVSDNFGNITPGEIVWITGHVGIYIGNKQVIESTTAWDASGVGKTLISTIGEIKRLRVRQWAKHGKLPYIDYGKGLASLPPVDARESHVFI